MAQKIIILGAGESGVGAALLAKQKGFEVKVSDKGMIAPHFKKELSENLIEFEEGGHSDDLLTDVTEIIKSPGIPDRVPIIKEAKKLGIQVSSEIEFASRFTTAKIVAITGTNGKTTTTLLTHHLLQEAGLDVEVAGNIGESFARKVAEKDHDYFVLEISSFQLDDIHYFKPSVAILLNITPDHLDRYDNSMEKYAAAKFRMIENMRPGDLFIYNADDEHIAKEINKRETNIWTATFSEANSRGNALHIPRFYSPAIDEPEELANEQLIFDGLPLRGAHNAMNMSAAIIAALRVGCDKEAIEKGLKTFKNAAHRLEVVAKINGITFINDSKATNVDATSYALDAFETPIIWIAGGTDKGNDYEQILHKVNQNVKGIICLGVDNEKLLRTFGEMVSYVAETQDVNKAVMKAYHLADSGDIVLLSPACASFDLFKNYEDRGDQFKKAVHEQLGKLDTQGDYSLDDRG
ncbi:UDP-N-acetylmuramoyl-L-alanine--D-glutamate ligase [Flammeovirgaceae bacterium SG7u.111]|nr:UDP-N-acetylmuramoyl-L-alanine--D-glutamate ligase [Flammeovirgaceae bacterium SG7u.132]WPO33808.1 UDP-N-acetylmuramoyl-L-alanine--D-glutamate ligase [Flammeovirgaceae bacterium SG7u.111]